MELWEHRNKQARSLSGGMKRRLLIARSLVHHPKLLFLDEPTAGVDIEIRRSMWEFVQEINQQGTTIILTTHYLEEAESLCKNVAIINDGMVVKQGAVSELLSESSTQTYVFDVYNSENKSPELGTFTVNQFDGRQLEVEVSQQHGLNQLFTMLTTQGFEVSSMRTKTNRLEEFFLRLVNKN